MMKRILVIFLVILLMLASSVSGAFAGLYDNPGIKATDAVEKATDYLYTLVSDPMCSGTGGEWVLYGLATYKYDMDEAYLLKYKNSVEETVKTGFRGTAGILHNRKYTEYERVVYCYGTLAKYCKEKGYSVEFDPTNVAGYNLLEKLSDYDRVIWQGINSPIWALIALDSNDYEMEKITASTDGSGSTEFTQGTRQMYVDYILKYQHTDGGWSMDIDDLSSVSDPDVTGMAVQALANYRYQSKVKKAVAKAVTCMSNLQNSDGTYSCYGAKNSESAAQIIMALVKLGIDPEKDSRFIKNGNSVVDSLLMFFDESTGGFRHVNEAQGGYQATVNQMATEQGTYALANLTAAAPKALITGVKSGKSKALTVNFEKQGLADGYVVSVSTDKNFKKNVKNYTLKKSSSSKTITSLKSGKTYYVKVKAYRLIDGNKVYGSDSTVKSAKVK